MDGHLVQRENVAFARRMSGVQIPYCPHMTFKVVKPDEPSVQATEKKMIVLPREESYRIRRAGRQAFDQYLPRAMEIIAEMAMDEDAENRKWAADKILKAVLANRPNEDVDPESASVVDGSVTSKDALKQLEETTQDGTGQPDPDAI